MPVSGYFEGRAVIKGIHPTRLYRSGSRKHLISLLAPAQRAVVAEARYILLPPGEGPPFSMRLAVA